MAIDIDQSHYNTGTATVAGTAVTGQGTAWLGAVRKGDLYGTHRGSGVRIASVNSNTSLTLAYAVTGLAQTAAPYEIQRTPFDLGYERAIEDIIRLMGDGALPALAALDGTGGNKLIKLTGPNTSESFDGKRVISIAGLSGSGVVELAANGDAALVPKADLISGIKVDRRVATLADRAAFDAQSAQFSVNVADVGNGRAATYFKQSNAVGDWSPPAYETGADGTPSTVPGPPGIIARGAYDAATTYAIDDWVTFNGSSFRKRTTAPAGAAPSSASPPISTADWEVTAAKGLNGTGTGDMIGPSTSVADQFVAFADGSGKNTKVAPYTPLNKAGDTLSGTLGSRLGASGSHQIIRDVGWSALPRRWAEAINADASYSLCSYDAAGAAVAEEFRLTNQGGDALFRGSVRASNQPGFSAFGVSTGSSTWGNAGPLSFNGTILYNIGGAFSGTIFTAPVTGTYHFDAGLVAQNNVAGTKQVFFRKNGVNAGPLAFLDANISDGYLSIPISADIRLSAGDTVGVGCIAVTGSPFFVAGNVGYHHFSGHLVA